MNEASSGNMRPFAHEAPNHCFGCGQANEVGLQLKFLLTQENSVVCEATVSDAYEGPPGYLHGGIIATLLDESMSKAVRARGLVAMTRKMSVEYLAPVRSCSAFRLEGHLIRSEGRKHWTAAELKSGEGHVLAKGEGLFLEISAAQRRTLEEKAGRGEK